MPKKLLLALLPALLLWLSWPQGGLTPLVWIAFIPLLLLEKELDGVKRPYRQLFGYGFLSIGLWYLLTIFWLRNASWIGVIAAIMTNGILFALVLLLFRYIKQRLGEQRGYLSLPFLWISAEAVHNYWELSFPWLTLGNVFAERVTWIQWYEITGVYGGSLWVWALNLSLFMAWRQGRQVGFSWRRPFGKWLIASILLLLIPLGYSQYRYHNYSEQGTAVPIVVVQPNFDAYTEKFNVPEEQQLRRFIDLARPLMHDSIRFLVGPETMLPRGIYEQNLAGDRSIRTLRQWFESYPQLAQVVGATTRKFYHNGEQTATARPFADSDHYYDAFNSALLLRPKSPIKIYHKSKLVAGVEMMPYQAYIEPLLGNLVQDFGGITGTLGSQEKRSVFSSVDKHIKVAPVICWESDYGDYVTDYVKLGAQLLFIITNDDWWGNTQGHLQHLHYARLRAIENRRSIARSANTGVSCFINQRGDVLQAQPYKTAAAIAQSLRANDQITYYTRAGDVVVRVSFFIALFLMLFALVRGFLTRSGSKV